MTPTHASNGRGGPVAAVRRWVRSLYDWTIRWADTPSALTALFFISLAESSFFPIPPDVLLIAIVAANPKRWLTAASLCTLGSLIGAMVGYYIGSALMATIGQPIVDFYQAQDAWDTVAGYYNSDGGRWFLLGAAFTPLPYKVATIAAGATGMDVVPFLVISSIGRAGRFFLVAVLLRIYGAPIRAFIEKHFDWLAVVFLVLLIGGFVAIRFLH